MQTFHDTHFSYLLAFFNLGTPELLIVLVVALLIFGRRLPDVARSFGKSINEFKKGMSEVTSEINKEPMDQASSQNAAKLPNANSANAMGQNASQAQESDASKKV